MAEKARKSEFEITPQERNAHKNRAEIFGGKIQITRCGDDACEKLNYGKRFSRKIKRQ
ncbi:MAG: hypothetical protein AB1403_18735 [Candidatus Riflebacteria bacterium]